MPVWETPSSSESTFQRVGPASIKRKKKKDGWLDVPGNFLTDIKDAAVGMALSVPRGAGHVTNDINALFNGGEFESDDAAWGMLKAVKDDYAYTYAPLLGIGDAEFNPGLTLSRIKEHPLGPVLDVLALFSGGAALAGKGGKFAAGSSGSARGAKWAGLESKGKLFDEAGDIKPSAMEALARKTTDNLGNLVPDRNWIELKQAEFGDPQAWKDRVKELGGTLGPDSEIFLPKRKRVTPKGVDSGGYERIVGESAYTRARQNAVDAFASKFHNAPMMGASVRGARQNTRRADQSAVIEAQALAARLERDAARMDRELIRFFGSAFPSSSIDSEIAARKAQMETLSGVPSKQSIMDDPAQFDRDDSPEIIYEDLPMRREQIRSEIANRERGLVRPLRESEARQLELDNATDLEKIDFITRAKGMGEIGVASIANRDAYLNSYEFQILREGLKTDRDVHKLDNLIDEMAKANPKGAARLSSIVSDKNKVEGFRGFMRDMLKAYYEKIGPDMVYAKETAVVAKGKDPKASTKDSKGMAPEEFAQIQRAFREENQFRALAGNPVKDYVDYADAEAAAFKYAEEILGSSIDDIRGSSTLGVPVMSHSIVREGVDPDFSTGAGGKPGTLPKPGTPEFMKNTFITNEFALNQMNGPKPIIRALEHAALAKSSTARFRGLISQMYKGPNAPGKGWVRLDDNNKSRLRNGVHDIVSFMDDDFTVLSGGNQVDMVATMGETLRKMAADLDAEGDVWVPKGSMKALFNGIERESHMAAALYGNATKIWRNLTLGLRPQWMVNNMVGNLSLLAMEHGLWNSMRSMAVAYKDTFYDAGLERKRAKGELSGDEERSIASVLRADAPAVMETGQYREGVATSSLTPVRASKGAEALDEGTFEAQLKEWMAEQDGDESNGDTLAKMSVMKKMGGASKEIVTGQAGLKFNSKWIDDPARRASFLANMHPHIKRLQTSYKAKTGEDMSKAEAIARLLQDDEMKDFAIQKTLRDMIDYREMTPNERKWLRGTFPFYAWLRGMSKRYMQLLVEKPELMSAIQHVAEISNENPDFDDKYPEWMRRMAKLDPGTIADLVRGDAEGGTSTVNLSSANIFQTPADIATLINAALYGDKDDLAATGSVANYSNPFVKAAIEVLVGKNLYTGRQLPENVTDPEMNNALLLAKRMGSAFPLARDVMEWREQQDPEYVPMTEPGQLGVGRFFQPLPNTLVDEPLAMEARERELEREAQELERALEIQKRKDAAKNG